MKKKMKWWEFLAICEANLISPGIALEREEVKQAIKLNDKQLLEKILVEEF